jgi:hypothetical protein
MMGRTVVFIVVVVERSKRGGRDMSETMMLKKSDQTIVMDVRRGGCGSRR